MVQGLGEVRSTPLFPGQQPQLVKHHPTHLERGRGLLPLTGHLWLGQHSVRDNDS